MEFNSIMKSVDTGAGEGKSTCAQVAHESRSNPLNKQHDPKKLFKDRPLISAHCKRSEADKRKLWSPWSRARREAQFQKSLDMLREEYETGNSKYEIDLNCCPRGHGVLDTVSLMLLDPVLGHMEWCDDCCECVYGVEPFQAKKASWIEAWIENVDASDSTLDEVNQIRR